MAVAATTFRAFFLWRFQRLVDRLALSREPYLSTHFLYKCAILIIDASAVKKREALSLISKNSVVNS